MGQSKIRKILAVLACSIMALAIVVNLQEGIGKLTASGQLTSLAKKWEREVYQ